MQNEVSIEKSIKPQLISERRLLTISVSIAIYFLSIFLLNFFEVDFTLIGVFRELLTIPMLVGQLIFLIMAIATLVKRLESKLKHLTVMSILLLSTSSILTIGSFF